MRKTINTLLILTLLLTKVYSQTTQLEEYVEQGVQLYDKGDYKGAVEQYKKALKLDGMSPLANYEIASTYFVLKDYEKAVAHSEKVIKAKSKYIDLAYIINGSALDMMGKTKEAIKIYKTAIKEYPQNYLLHYNLALTSYNIKEYKESEGALIQALKIKPTHASSHLLLGFVMDEQYKRVQSLLALYNFLLLEPTGTRAQQAYDLLNSLLRKGVKRDDEKTTTITLSDNNEDEFRAAELMISLLEASKNIEENKNKSESELFYENTKSLFTVLGELKKDKKGFWWNFYVDFYYSMTADSNNVQAFCYYISQINGDQEVNDWLKNNKDKLDRFSTWYAEIERKD